MASGERNQWLDAGGSEEDEFDRGYDSEAHDESHNQRATKRRRIENSNNGNRSSQKNVVESEEDDIESEVEPSEVKAYEGTHDLSNTARLKQLENQKEHLEQSYEENVSEKEDDREEHAAFTGPARSLAPLSEATSNKKLAPRKLKDSTRRDPYLPPPGSKSGVIYISRVPPYMKPSALRTLLAPHAPHGGLGRIFLNPEDPETYSQRKRLGGNKKKSFVDGWVEFVSKRDAKAAAELLNARTIGEGIGRKGVGRFYKETIWNFRYLRGFKWANLVEQMRNETAERGARMRAEINQATRENKNFTKAVELSKIEKTRELKRRKRDAVGPHNKEPVKESISNEKSIDAANGGTKMHFKQHLVKDKDIRNRTERHKDQDSPHDDVQRVLKKIF